MPIGISSELYKAAAVDGAGRFRRIWHVSLPGLRSTIITLLIMNWGRILGSEFDRSYALSNKLITSVSNTISIFVYQNGICSSQFSRGKVVMIQLTSTKVGDWIIVVICCLLIFICLLPLLNMLARLLPSTKYFIRNDVLLAERASTYSPARTG